jgi:hypothetical protein
MVGFLVISREKEKWMGERTDGVLCGISSQLSLQPVFAFDIALTERASVWKYSYSVLFYGSYP